MCVCVRLRGKNAVKLCIQLGPLETHKCHFFRYQVEGEEVPSTVRISSSLGSDNTGIQLVLGVGVEVFFSL